MIQLGVTSMTKTPMIGISFWITHALKRGTTWCLVSQASPVQRLVFCFLISELLQRIVFWIQPWQRLAITVYSQNWHATCETVNVFVFICTIWLSNAGGETHRKHCNTTVNIHTHCCNRMIISQETIGERRMIYCEAIAACSQIFFLYFSTIGHI